MENKWEDFFLFHGWLGNDPNGWLCHFYKDLVKAGVNAQMPVFPRADKPDLPAWKETLNLTMVGVTNPGKSFVACHSLGGITWLLSAAHLMQPIVDVAVLVVPPYLSEHLRPKDAPPGVEMFARTPFAKNAALKAARRTIIVAGEDDYYAGSDQSRALAEWVGAEIYFIEKGKHMSPGSGYGHWEWISAFALGHTELPPQPNTWSAVS